MDIRTVKKLNNGVEMPLLGLGVFRSVDEEAAQAVKWAIEVGYRHIDTAKIYNNERSTGEGVWASGIAREDMFITTKLWNADMRKSRQMNAFEKSLKHLGTDYVDLYLIHWPVENFTASWKVMEEMYRSGRAKAIGVSNFLIHHLETLLSVAEVIPAVNQIETHPYLQENELIKYCENKGIAVEAYSPLGGEGGDLIHDPLVLSIAQAHKKTPAQVLLRWNLERGVIVIPKSIKKERIIENAALYDFKLTDEEITMLNALERGKRYGADPDNFSF